MSETTATVQTDRQTGTQIVIDALCHAGVERVFGYPGGAIMPLYDALLDSPIEHILTRHEQGAIHAADGYARATGQLGVCIATSGPGATNLVTGICTAMMDSSPVLCLTGQVNTPTIGTDAFQEADVLGIVTTVTKQAFLVRSLHDLPEAMAEAIHIARTGRPGPVLVDLPKNVLQGVTAGRYEPLERVPGYEPMPVLDRAQVAKAHGLLRAAERPVAIIGGGCKLSGATELFRAWCERAQVPVAATLHGLGAVDRDYPHRLGMLGMHGLRCANRAVGEADLIIGLGMRFDDRVTGQVSKFARNARVVHVDIDAAEIGKIIPTEGPVHGDLREALAAWIELLEAEPVTAPTEWQAYLAGVGTGLQAAQTPADEQPSSIEVLDALFELIGPETVISTDVGQHQMWAAQRAWPAQPRGFVTSGGAGTMGFGLPAAMGAQFACPERPVVAILGDGGFQMTMAELATIKRCNLPLKILVLDNKYLGMVRQWQEMFFERRYSGVDLSDNPDFAALADVYGISAFKVRSAGEIRTRLPEWWQSPGPALLHAECRLEESVFPMVPPNAALDEMLESEQ